MTELYGSDGRAISNVSGTQSDSTALQDQANSMMRQNRPGIGQMLSKLARGNAPVGGYQQGKFDNSANQAQPESQPTSLAVPELYGTVELRAGMGPGLQVPPGVEPYDLFDATVKRHGRIGWQGGRPTWTDLDYRNMSTIYGDVDPRTQNLVFNIDCPTRNNGKRRDTIVVKHGMNSDGSIQAEMVSSYPFGGFSNMPRAMYSGGIQMVQEVQQPVNQFQPQAQQNDSIGSVMPGTPMNNPGMEQAANNGNFRQDGQMNGSGDQASVIAAQQKQIQELQQQNQNLKDTKGHPVRDAVLGLGMVGLQAGMQYMNNRGRYGGYGNYGYGGYGRGIPFVNGGRIPFINNRRNGRYW